jgi:acetyltransferase
MRELIRDPIRERVTRFRSRRGHDVLIRPSRPSDQPALQQMLASLSPRTIGMRYFIPDVPLPPVRAHQEAERLTRGDQIVYLALSTGSSPQIVAVAEAMRDKLAPQVAETAIMVADIYQGEGIGSTMIGCLAEAINQSDIAIIRAITQAHNQVVRHMITRLERPYTTTYWRGEVIYEIAVA